jgi:hypothetical protein
MSIAEMSKEERLEDIKIERLEMVAAVITILSIVILISSGYFLVHDNDPKRWIITFFGSGTLMVLNALYEWVYITYRCRIYLEKYAKEYYGYKGIDGKSTVIIIDDEPLKTPQKSNSNTLAIIGVWIFLMGLLVFAFPSDASSLTIIIFGIVGFFISLLAVVRIINGSNG